MFISMEGFRNFGTGIVSVQRNERGSLEAFVTLTSAFLFGMLIDDGCTCLSLMETVHDNRFLESYLGTRLGLILEKV